MLAIAIGFGACLALNEGARCRGDTPTPQATVVADAAFATAFMISVSMRDLGFARHVSLAVAVHHIPIIMVFLSVIPSGYDPSTHIVVFGLARLRWCRGTHCDLNVLCERQHNAGGDAHSIGSRWRGRSQGWHTCAATTLPPVCGFM